MKLYAMEDIIETLISVPDIKGAPYIELEEKLLELKPAMIIPECGGCMGASYNPRDCEECERRNSMSMEFYDRTDIVEVEKDAFERGYMAGFKEKRAKILMGRDMISRKEAIEIIDELLQGHRPYKVDTTTLMMVRGAIKVLPARMPIFETFCGLDIKDAAEIIEKYKRKARKSTNDED